MTSRAPARLRGVCARRPTGSAMVFVLALVLVLAVAGIALVRIAGNDRIDAAIVGQKDRGLACAEAGLQYGRRFFGAHYEKTATSPGWNGFLAVPTPGTPSYGYRYDAAHGDAKPDLSLVPLQTRGASDGLTLDPGADLDGDGTPDFWVSIRDDDDERPFGLVDDPTHDNNEAVIVRSECTNPGWAFDQGGQKTNVVLESVLTHIQGSSGYATSARGTNSMDLVGGR